MCTESQHGSAAIVDEEEFESVAALSASGCVTDRSSAEDRMASGREEAADGWCVDSGGLRGCAPSDGGG